MNTPTHAQPQPDDQDMTLNFLDEIGERLSCLDNDSLFALNYVALLNTLRDFVVHELDRFTDNGF